RIRPVRRADRGRRGWGSATFRGHTAALIRVPPARAPAGPGGLRSIAMFANLIALLKNEDGATAIEYGLIAALIAVAAVTVMTSVGRNLGSTFTIVASKL